ncbi:MAG: sugar ABC transporter ATP-binding protein [Oscillospiraceae bacterium]|nr:sugar ABC transporter ATP-binding protein [Oscillospiraceae bacterium]
MQQHYVEFQDITKIYPGVVALKDVSFRLEGGKVTALAGENGAGKSTLLKVLSGDILPDMGKIVIDGEEKRFTKPMDAISSSISVIYQERQLVPSLSVMENIFLEDLPCNKLGFVDKKLLKEKTEAIVREFGLDISPTAPVMTLPVAYQQMIEIMKAYRRNSSIIAFDEPTASLTDAEIDILFSLIEKMREEGRVIIYVSHRMSEIFRITDEVVVLKDGQFVKTLETANTTEQELVAAMVGRQVGDTYSSLSRNDKIGDVILEVEHLESEFVHDISFKLHKGEILGFSGLVGAGRTETMRAIFGADPIIGGKVIIDGEEVHFKDPAEAIKGGIALAPEDRKEQGLILPRSIKDNITIPVLDRVKKGIFMDKKQEVALADEAIETYSIHTPSSKKIVAELSGGNQQKVILGRWTSSKMNTKVLILDEPTKGIDVRTKAEIYQLCCDFAKQGKGIIFISSELTEVLNLCDRIIVMHNGVITGEVLREEATEEKVMALAMKE